MTSKYNPFQYWESLIIIAGILYLSFAPPSTFNGVPSFTYEDKLVHLLLYSGLTFILIFDFHKRNKHINIKSLPFLFICIITPILLGGLVEILQPIYFAPRTAEWFDWFSDIAGTLLGLFSARLLKKFKIWF